MLSIPKGRSALPLFVKQLDLFVKQPLPPIFSGPQILEQLLNISDFGGTAGLQIKRHLKITAMAPEISSFDDSPQLLMLIRRKNGYPFRLFDFSDFSEPVFA